MYRILNLAPYDNPGAPFYAVVGNGHTHYFITRQYAETARDIAEGLASQPDVDDRVIPQLIEQYEKAYGRQ
jgi:hypothetical protein